MIKVASPAQKFHCPAYQKPLVLNKESLPLISAGSAIPYIPWGDRAGALCRATLRSIPQKQHSPIVGDKAKYRPVNPPVNERTMLQAFWDKDDAAFGEDMLFVIQPLIKPGKDTPAGQRSLDSSIAIECGAERPCNGADRIAHYVDGQTDAWLPATNAP
jgi:hypothetical protein